MRRRLYRYVTLRAFLHVFSISPKFCKTNIRYLSISGLGSSAKREKAARLSRYELWVARPRTLPSGKRGRDEQQRFQADARAPSK